jgi:hypothetical protein
MEKPLIVIKDELYQVIKKIPEQDDLDIELFRIKTQSTNVFKKDGYLWFCSLIENANILK